MSVEKATGFRPSVFLHKARMVHNRDWPLVLYEGTTYREDGTNRQHLVLCRDGSYGNDPLGRVVLDVCTGNVVSFAPVDRLPYGVAIALIRLGEGKE